MTTKPNTGPSAGKRKRKTPKATACTNIELPVNGNEDDAKALLAKSLPGWENLSKTKQSELTTLAIAKGKTSAPVKVKLTRKPDGGNTISMDGDCETLSLLKLQKTFGAVSMDPVNARASELLKYLGSVGADSTDRYNAALSFIESMGPKDQSEVLLLVQLYVTHDAAMRALSQLGGAEWVPQVQTFGNLATKLLRASQGQLETLARMRRGGEQVVRHIHVDNRGGQTVIAENLTPGGQGNNKNEDQSHATYPAGIGPALLGQDSFGNGVPVASRERAESVPYARRDESGCA